MPYWFNLVHFGNALKGHSLSKFDIVLLAIDAIDVINGASLKAVITVPCQPEWCRSKLVLSLWFIMRVTVYITVLFICSVCSDGSWCWGGACMARVTNGGQTHASTTSHLMSLTSHLAWHLPNRHDVMSVLVSQEAEVLLANLAYGHDNIAIVILMLSYCYCCTKIAIMPLV